MYPLVLFLIAIGASVAHLTVSKQKMTARLMVKVLLAYILPLNIGIAGVLAFIAHAFYGPQTAELIGWPADNPFQMEIAMANLGLGVTGLLCIWMRKGFWLACALFAAIFSWGAAYVHIIEMAKGNYAAYNSGVFVYVGDLAMPLIYLILAGIYAAQCRFFRNNYMQ
jgi:hypothetical protein